MTRFCVLGGLFMLTLCATAQAQIETIVVTASFVGPRAQKFLEASSKRLTPDGKAFVEYEGKQVYDGTIDAADIRSEAQNNCASAFETCGGDDASALAALVLGKSLSDSMSDVHKLASGFSPSADDHTAEQIQACEVRNDLKCARKVFMKSLPPERRQAFEHFGLRVRKIRHALDKLLASMGFDQKDDR
jgi:hypothetical protein